MTSTTSYLGMQFLHADLEGIRKTLAVALEGKRYGYVVTPNVDHVVSYHQDLGALREVYDGALFQICDSRILSQLARLSGIRLIPIPGSDLTRDLLERPLTPAVRIAVLGPSQEAFDLLQSRYPNVDLQHLSSASQLTRGSPEWHETLSRAVVSEWDLLLICLSFPKQEFFARDLAIAGRSTGLGLCVGASIDFLTDRQTRAPLWVQRSGLEWMYRLAGNPRRMMSRYLLRGPRIFGLVARDMRTRRSVTAEPAGSAADAPSAKVLYLTTVLPDLRQTGGEIASMNFIEALRAAECEVDVVGYRRKGRLVPIPAGFESPCDLLIESADSKIQTAIWLVGAFIRGRAFSVQKYVTPAMHRHVERKLRSDTYGLVVLDHIQAAWILPSIPPGVPVVFVAHNVEHQLYTGFGLDASKASKRSFKDVVTSYVYRREGEKLRELETQLARRSREIWTLTHEDAAAFHVLAPSRRVQTFDLPGQTFGQLPLARTKHSIGLIGSWNWDVNRVGLEWFLHDVLPQLPDDLDVVIAGRSRYPEGKTFNKARFVGFVPDAGDFLRSSGVVVIPSTLGSGIQIKTIETLATGVPTVATSVAMRGISDVPPNVWIADEPEAMVEAILAALEAGRPDGTSGWAWQRQRKNLFDRKIAATVAPLHRGHPFDGTDLELDALTPARSRELETNTV